MIHIIHRIAKSPFCENPDFRSYLTPLSGGNGDMTATFVTFVTYHVTFECFEGKFIYDVKGTLRLMINLKVILNLNILINRENIREI